MDTDQRIRKYIIENFLFGEANNTLKNEVSFLEEGIIDSTGVLELVQFLEEEFGLQVADEELIPENLDSVNNLVGFVNRKLQVDSHTEQGHAGQ